MSQNNNNKNKKQQRAKTVKVLNKELKKASKVVQKAIQPGVAPGQARKMILRNTGIPPTLLFRWAKAVAKPFESRGAICPVSFNPAPSLMCTTATTTYTDLNIGVSAGTTTQYVFYPGHLPGVPTVQTSSSSRIASEMDATAYHAISYVGVAAGGRLTMGPVALTPISGPGTAGGNSLRVQGLPLDGATNNSTLASGVPGAAGFDEALPYSYGGTTHTSSHIRWQLVSMGIRFVNQTPAISRGGNVTSVQLVNNAGLRNAGGAGVSRQGELEHNPSFKLLGVCDELTEIAWIPRLEDLAYWHGVVPLSHTSTDSSAVIDTMDGAALAVFFNNPTSATQNYAMQVIYNWQLSGSYLASVSEAAVVEPVLKAPIEQTVVQLANTSSTAAHAPVVAAAASTSSVNESSGMFDKLSKVAFDGAADIAHKVGSKFMEHAGEQVNKLLHNTLYPGMPPRKR